MFGAAAALLAVGMAVMAPKASATGETRTLSLYEIHTKESLTVTYKRNGQFDEDALKKLNHFMRDWRADKETQMDRELIDLIWTLHETLGSKQPVHLVSGYRSPGTNEKMRRAGGGQAKKSQHMLGKASDLHFPDVPVKRLRASALIQEVGGVGYYPTSGLPFVHVDTGRVRMWPRMPRLELAALFPSGRTGYIPSDGRPISPADYKLALAKGLVSNTMVASAAPLPTPKPQIGSPSRSPLESPQPILASYTPNQAPTPAPMALAPADDPVSPRFAYASAGGGFSLPQAPRLLPKAHEAKVPSYEAPTYESAQVVGAPEMDDDHPDELSYVPFDTASLMTDTSVARSQTLTPLVHPEQGNLDYLFDDMDQPTEFQLRASSGYRGLASAQKFSGGAVKSLYAEMEAPAPTRLARR
ncbi:MAG TPA: DUF882 domain-containing protein [Methyloceanibacter sp.]|nr:DUF882 domain-containing protein [Methyloceanibacter sp.]